MPVVRKKSQTSGYRLAVDIGNTQTVLGLFQADAIQRTWRVATRKDTTVDEIAFLLRGLTPAREFAAAGAHEVSAAVLASVVPAQDSPWLAALEEVFGVVPEVLSHRNCLGLKLEYEIPRQIGADRLANVLGAEALGIDAGVVIDFGTATTFDVFAHRTYFGGVICPGIQSSMRVLTQSAAKLAEAELRWPESAVGRNTDDAMRIGILHGTVGLVERLLSDILRERKLRRPVVLATGGLGFWMQGHTRAIHRFEPNLTLMGMNHLLSKQRSAKRKERKKP